MATNTPKLGLKKPIPNVEADWAFRLNETVDILDDAVLANNLSGFGNVAIIDDGAGNVTISGATIDLTQNAITGSNGITIISGSSTIEVQGFRPEFVAASGFLDTQFFYKNIKSFGAQGDGLNDDTIPLQNTLDNVESSTTVVPSGTYLVSGLIVNNPQTIMLSDGAVIKLADSSNIPVIDIKSNNVSVLGQGTIDANRSNQSGVFADAVSCSGFNNFLMNGVKVQESLQRGVYVQDSDDAAIRNCTITNTGRMGIQGRATVGTLNNFTVHGCVVDRSDDPANNDGCIEVTRDTNGLEVQGPLVANNTVIMNPDPTGSNVVPIEFFGGIQYGRITNNYVKGGNIAISIARSENCTVVGNTVFDAGGIGVEIADSQYCTVIGNSIDGNDNATSGITIDGGNVLASGNAITGNSVTRINENGIYLINSAPHTTINSNTVLATGTISNGVRIQNSDFVQIVGNTIDGRDTGRRGILHNNSNNVMILSNTIRGWDLRPMQIVANAQTVDRITIINNDLDGNTATTQFLEQSGGTITNVVQGGNLGHVFGFPLGTNHAGETFQPESSNINEAIHRVIMDTTPEGDLEGRRGSFVQRWNGDHDAALLYVKSSNGGNTGWRPVQVVASGTTANRPNLSVFDTGFSYFDTTLGSPIWWNGSDWITSVDGGDALLIDGSRSMTGQLDLIAGSEAAPSFIFDGDTDTGLFRPSPNTIDVATSGTRRVRVAADGKVGLADASSSPLHTLDIRDDITNVLGTDDYAQVRVRGTNARLALASTGSSNDAEIVFLRNSSTPIWRIGLASASDEILRFRDVDTGENILTLDSAANGGLVGIGASPTDKLTVNDDTIPDIGSEAQIRAQGTVARVSVSSKGESNSATFQFFRNTSDLKWRIGLENEFADNFRIRDGDLNDIMYMTPGSGGGLVGINNQNPSERLHVTGSGIIEGGLSVNSSTDVFLPPRLTNSQKDNLSNPATGSMIFNTTSGTVNVFDSSNWRELAYL